jgi:hypothetical protein
MVYYIYMNKFIGKNKASVSIILFLMCFYIVFTIKPQVFFNNDGSIKQFGLGYKHKTIFPIWLLSIVMSIIIYIMVYYYSIRF